MEKISYVDNIQKKLCKLPYFRASYAAFCFMCAVLLKVATFLFLQLFVPSDSTFA